MATAILEAEVVKLDAHPIPLVVDPREQLLMLVRGSQITIPDLQSMISHWPQGIHPEIEKLDEYVQETLQYILPSSDDEKRLRKMTASKFDLFGASWWPYASYEALRVVTCMSIWLFAWDDETDSLEFTSVSNDWSKASTFREKTIEYLQHSLSGSSKIGLSGRSTDPFITSFRPVGEAISKTCNDRQISTLLDELVFFVNMSAEEQKLQVMHRLPTIKEYMQRRLGTSAVRVCLATIEYAYGITLSKEILDDEAMQCIWHETNVIVSVTNDILSVRKEVAQSQVDSLIPLLAPQLGSAQAAINHAVEIVQSSIQRFEQAEKQILEGYAQEPEVYEDVRKFIEGCKYACTSNLNWR
ncbi:terpenoid synthase [Hypoxylon fuscum]|nr:terpenoid synthase [Hypoxylon fuscum]